MATAEENHAKIDAFKNSGGNQRSEDAMASSLMQDKNQAKSVAGSNSSAGKAKLAETGKKDPAAAASVSAKLNQATAGLLKTSWTNIILFSFTTSIIWIDVHVLGNMIFPKMFCKLGHEWIPPEMQKASPQKAEAFGDKVGSCEKGACCCANGFCGLILISIIAVVAVIIKIFDNPIGSWFQ